jgi:hypothetical protein
MRQWPEDSRIKTYRYEDIVSDQLSAFKDMVNHLQITGLKKRKLLFFAKKYSLQNRKKDKHIRDPKSGQWRNHSTPEMNEMFVKEYGDVLEKYSYPLT